VSVVDVPYTRRPAQRAFHAAMRAAVVKHFILVWHRRAGKTVALINELQRQAMESTAPRARYAYVAPFLKQAKIIAWDYLVHYSSVIPGVKVNAGELSVDYPNGARVRLFGADNPDSLRGIYLDGVVLDEYGQIPKLLRTEVLLPALADRDGWEVLCGTPKGRNQFYYAVHGDDEWVGAVNDPAWLVNVLRASESGIFTPEQLQHLKRQMGADLYAQEMECDWSVSDKGSFLGRQLEVVRRENRITTVGLSTGIPVITGWDLGIGDATSIWFAQVAASELHVIDYYESTGEGLAHYAKVLQDKGYLYGKHFFPHDAAARSKQTGITYEQMANKLGIRPSSIVPIGDFDASVEGARQLLANAWFDAEKCKAGIAALDAWRKVFNARMGQHGDEEQHDWASHGAAAWRTLAMAKLGHKLSPRMFEKTTKPRFARM
jgi:phage terminase large subunit